MWSSLSDSKTEEKVGVKSCVPTTTSVYSGVSLKYYNSECNTLNSFGYCGIILKGRPKMFKNTMLIIFLFSLFISSNEYAYANE